MTIDAGEKVLLHCAGKHCKRWYAVRRDEWFDAFVAAEHTPPGPLRLPGLRRLLPEEEAEHHDQITRGVRRATASREQAVIAGEEQRAHHDAIAQNKALLAAWARDSDENLEFTTPSSESDAGAS